MSKKKQLNVVDWMPPVTVRRIGSTSSEEKAMCVYHTMDANGGLVYIGLTKQRNFIKRMRSHRCSSDWWSEVKSIYVEIVQDKFVASDLEGYRIGSLRPRFNKDFNGDYTQKNSKPGYKPFDPFKGRMCADSTCKFASKCNRFNGGDTSNQDALLECHAGTPGTDSYFRSGRIPHRETQQEQAA